MIVRLLVILLLVLLALGGVVFYERLHSGIVQARESATMQKTRTIALAMFQYANDNNGKYPDGNSSTEAFQKLIDGNYVSDPLIFYVPCEGKTKPLPGQRLKPENVSFDITGGVDLNSPDSVPLVFLTGYRVDYAPGGKAVALVAPYPAYRTEPRTWWEWWHRLPKPDEPGPFISVTYHSNQAYAKLGNVPPSGPVSFPNFVPKDFDAHGKTYRQLTPEGPLK